MMEIVKTNPFPALFDDAEDGGYPKSEMGYIRAYFRSGMWNNTCFPVGQFKESLANEFNQMYQRFTELNPTLGKMRDNCRNNAKRLEDWCGYEQYEAYMETPIALYRFVMRFAPGDYNLYMHCYDRYEIPWSEMQWIEERVMENYECGEEVLNTAYFDFNVSMKQSELLAIYAKIQKEINGDDVTYPEDVPDEKYVGNYAKFLLSFNGKEGYSRTAEDIDHLEFAI